MGRRRRGGRGGRGGRDGLRLFIALTSSFVMLASCESAGHRAAPPSTTPATPVAPSSLPYYTPFVDRLPIPAFVGGCAPASANRPGEAGEVRAIPVRILKQSSLNSEIFAGVCVNGKGPFPFIVDTGASTSVVDVGLARKVGLLPDQSVTLAPCTQSILPRVPRSMSVGDLPLQPRQVIVAGLATSSFPLDGILGEDVLSSFGAVRFDYTAQTITVLLPQHFGDATPTVPSGLLSGTVRSIPLRSLYTGQPVSGRPYPVGMVIVPVSLGSTTTSLLVDTGAQSTLVTPEVAGDADLQLLSMRSRAYAGLGCAYGLRYFSAASWSLGGLPLPSQPVASLPNFLVAGGSLGSGTLQQFGVVVVDFADGLLRLGRLARPALAAYRPIGQGLSSTG